MQKTSKDKYKFPHQFQNWAQKKQILQSVQEANDLSVALNSLNSMKSQKINWKVSSLTSKLFKQPEVLDLIKYIAKKALMVQTLFTSGIEISKPLPHQQLSKTWIVLTKMQCCCLVANMFLCTIEPQKCHSDLPTDNTFRYLSQKPNYISKTMLVYFRKIKSYEESNLQMLHNSHVVYMRLSYHMIMQEWIKNTSPLCKVTYRTTGAIQDLGTQIQMDFANKSIGGFFLCHTFTQEDIIFINNPQLIPALLFHTFMLDHQSILMIGSQTVATYTGYLDTYKMSGQYEDEREMINLVIDEKNVIKNVRDNWISAIDAIPQFYGKEFNKENTLRQLNKAFCGFDIQRLDGGQKVISTGNWGSGAFAGNLQYKFLIQWIAASAAGRSIEYFSFNDERSQNIPKIVKQCEHLKAGELCKILLSLSNNFTSSRNIFFVLSKYLKEQKSG